MAIKELLADRDAALALYGVNYNAGNAVKGLRAIGTNATFITTPSSAALNVSPDLDVRVKCSSDNWTSASAQGLASKQGAAGQISWRFGLQATNGLLQLRTSADGTVVIGHVSTVATGIANGATRWVRATLKGDNGAAGHDVTFYTSTDGVNWTQLGAVVTTAGTTSIFAGTQRVMLAGNDNIAEYLTGNIYEAKILNGINGTPVASPVFTGGGPTTDSQGNVWTYAGTKFGWDWLGDQYEWWKNNRSLAGLAVPWGSGGVGTGNDRAAQITAAAAALGITLPALGGAALVGPYQREESFWNQYRALPPTALP